MKTMILATATALAVLLCAPMAYAYQCGTVTPGELRCTTSDPNDVRVGKVIVSTRKAIELSFVYVVWFTNCVGPKSERRFSAHRHELRGYPAKVTLSFAHAVNEYQKKFLRPSPTGYCLEVRFESCAEHEPAKPKPVSCPDVLEARPG